MQRRIIGGTSAIALLLLAGAYTYHFLDWDFDDSYIIFRIVRNLLSGHGWAFNVGEAHNASTSVLNTVALALTAPLLSSNIPLAAHVLAGLWLSAAAVAFGWIFWQRFNAWVALGAGVGLIATLADNVLWGLETHLFVALLGLFVVLEHRKRNSWAVIGLLTLARPDALLLAGLRCLRDVRVWPWPASAAGWRDRVHAAWAANRRGLLVFVLILAPWVAFSLITFHQVFPDTLSNKMWQGRSGFWGTGPVYLKGLLTYIGSATPWRLAGYLMMLPGLVCLIRDRSVLLYVVAFAVVQQTGYTLLNVPGYHWYFASLDVAMVLAAFYGVGSIFQTVFEPHLRTAARSVSVALYISVLAFAAIRARPLFGPHYPQDQRERAYRQVAAAMLANRVQDGPIAAVEVGTLGYYLPNHSIIDLIGLTSANPEYLTGTHSDQFFIAPPSTVLLNAPASPMERAIFEDVRFEMLYDGPVAATLEKPMQYFELRTPDAIADYVEQRYPRFEREVAAPPVDAPSSADARCFLDVVNDKPAAPPLRIPRMVLRLAGWAHDRAEPGAPTDVFALLTSGGQRYSIRATRTARPDVAAAFRERRFTMSGYTLQGSIARLPPGEYQVSIRQKRGNGFVSCDVAPAITIVDIGR